MKIGAVLRVFSGKPENVDKAVRDTVELIEQCYVTGLAQTFCVVVPEDKDYPDHDCGETAEALKEMTDVLASNTDMQIVVKRLTKGEVFCDALNLGVDELQGMGCDKAAILSKEARSYVDPETVEAVVRAVEHREVLVTSVAIGEVADLVDQGAVCNTFAVWDIAALQAVEGFNSESAQVRKDETDRPMVDVNLDDGSTMQVPAQGVEDAGAVARLVTAFGRCVAIIKPRSKTARYEESADPDIRARNRKKWLSKLARILHFLSRNGITELRELAIYVVYRD